MSGRIDGSRRASIDLPEPGEPTSSTLCPPAAAISSARLTFSCPMTSAKSGPVRLSACGGVHGAAGVIGSSPERWRTSSRTFLTG